MSRSIATPLAVLVLAGALLGLAAAPAHAQIAGAVVPPGNNGVLQVDAAGNGAFAVIAANLGPTPGLLSAAGRCGGFFVQAHGAVATSVCHLDRATGACMEPILERLPTQIEDGEVRVYGVLVGGAQAGDRITVTFTQFSTLDFNGFPFRCAFPNVPPQIGAERGAVSILVAR